MQGVETSHEIELEALEKNGTRDLVELQKWKKLGWV